MAPNLETVRTYFDVLEISPGSTLVEITNAYKEQMQVWHPDRFGALSPMRPKAEERTKRINEAYGFLKVNCDHYTAQMFYMQQNADPNEPDPDSDTEDTRRSQTTYATSEREWHSDDSSESKRRSDQSASIWRSILTNVFARHRSVEGGKVERPTAQLIAEGIAGEIGRNLRARRGWVTLKEDKAGYTQELFRSLSVLGTKYGMQVYTDKPNSHCLVSRDYPRYDLIWKQDGRMAMAVESELAPSLEEILKDFRKLPYAPCQIRLLVHRYQQHHVVQAVEAELADCKRHTHQDEYLIIRIDDVGGRLEASSLVIPASGELSRQLVRFSAVRGSFDFRVHNEQAVTSSQATLTISNRQPLSQRVEHWFQRVRLVFSISLLAVKVVVGIICVILVLKFGMAVRSWVSSLHIPTLSFSSDNGNDTNPPVAPDETKRRPMPDIQTPAPNNAGGGETGASGQSQQKPDDQTRPVAPPIQEPQTEQAETLTAEELTNAYARSKSDANQQFKAETIRLRGTVTKVNKNELSFGSIKCKLGKLALPASIEVGSEVVIEGPVKGKSFWTKNITLDACRVITSSK